VWVVGEHIEHGFGSEPVKRCDVPTADPALRCRQGHDAGSDEHDTGTDEHDTGTDEHDTGADELEAIDARARLRQRRNVRASGERRRPRVRAGGVSHLSVSDRLRRLDGGLRGALDHR
jgi:hypothetical protein